jgi:cytoskeletal protein CcmA (bactofilin family)
MAFPTTPSNGQVATINGITYSYASSTNSWSRLQQSLPTLSINVDTFISNGSTLSYTLNVSPASKELVTVNIDGVLQQKTAYNISTNVLTLTGTPITGAVIEVKTIVAAPTSVLTGLVFDSFTGDNSSIEFVLSTIPTNKNFTLITVGGITQQKSSYSIIDNVLTLSTPPSNNLPIEVITFGPAVTSMLAGGSSNQIQVNNNGALVGYSSLTFNSSTSTLSTSNVTASGNVTVTGNLTVTGTVTGNVAGNVTGTAATVTTAAQPNITSLGTLTSLTVTGSSTLQLTADVLTLKTAATGVVTHDLTTGGIFYHTSPAANFTANFTNVPVTDNRVIMCSLIIIQGSTPYVSNAIQVEGSAYTIKWLGGTVPTGNASKVDVINVSLIRTSNSWTVLAQLSNYS